MSVNVLSIYFDLSVKQVWGEVSALLSSAMSQFHSGNSSAKMSFDRTLHTVCTQSDNELWFILLELIG